MKTIDAMATEEHAGNGLGPSGSSRWLQCPASVRMTKNAPHTTNPAAELGTAVHEIGELCLSKGLEPDSFIGESIHYHEVTPKMAEDAKYYVDYVRSLLTDTSELFVETKLNLEMIAEGTFGSADAIVITDETLHVIDYKNGRGHVNPVNNTQGQLYALGAYYEHSLFYDFEKVAIHIVQPNSSQGKHATSWEISIDQLLEFEQYAHTQAQLALTDDAPFCPSQTACQWCEYASECKAVYDWTMEIKDTPMPDLTNDDEVTLNMVADLLEHKKLIVEMFKKYEARILGALEDGIKVKGWKLVGKRANKKWVNEIEAYEKLIRWFKQDEFTTRKLSTPTQVIALMGKEVSTRKKNVFETLWEVPEVSNTLAPESDKRPAVEVTDGMEDISEEY